ncbi:hypothetical protein RFI_38588, partial [Reticulomyxa filosa]
LLTSKTRIVVTFEKGKSNQCCKQTQKKKQRKMRQNGRKRNLVGEKEDEGKTETTALDSLDEGQSRIIIEWFGNADDPMYKLLMFLCFFTTFFFASK